MTTKEIETKLELERQFLELKYNTARAIRKLLEEAEATCDRIGEEYDENEILDLVTDDA